MPEQTSSPSPASVQESAHLRQSAEDAARGVGDLLRKAFRSGLSADTKRNHHDLVTEYDHASERRITEQLSAAVPDSRFRGEEGGVHGSGRVEWIIDPIDGTSNFAHGVAFFCVSIAAAVDGEVVAGVVYDPIASLMFAADADGAYLDGAPLRPVAAADERQGSVMTDFPSAEDIATDGSVCLEAFAELVTAYSTVRRKVSGALELAHVAAGWTDITLGFDTNPWDVAAGAFLVTQSGGTYRAFEYDDVTRPAHEAPTYLAHGPGADAATATAVVERIMAGRRAAGYRGKSR
ncbi:inositol monophosphatase family protein [Zhihengliuella halotolerans]|uniref:inositol-phosphate phosphatase n=1 Tax=Zhihengliuella halotolerans TaxID=370736 RepID=A0A4Q8AAS9_9MICC|nr:inositol monophosphatase family protein [Zhihengliuella halotolerans]RZU60655.1 myo-inositol-1(or 4)-monophosphatase [Zhihengliuella halotolerans]